MALFTSEEYFARLAATKISMEGRGIELLLIASPENINYLSGYAGWSFYTPQILLVSLYHEEPVLIVREMDVACAEFTCFIKAENQIGYPEEFIGGERHPMEFIGEYVTSRGWNKGKIGIEIEAYFLSIRSYEILEEYLTAAELVPADFLVDWVRVIKSDAEMKLIRQAGTLASQAMQAVVDAIAVGVRECDVAAEFYYEQVHGTPDFGGSVPNSVRLQSGNRTAGGQLKWTDNRYAFGDVIPIELSGSRCQYHVALARTVSVGNPGLKILDRWRIIKECMATVLASLAPGKLCCEINEVFRFVSSKYRISNLGLLGFSQGLCFQPTNIERTLSFQGSDRTLLLQGMVLNLHISLFDDTRKRTETMSVSESIVITDGGYELLTKIPRELFVKI